MTTDIGGIKRVRIIFDKRATNVLFQDGRMKRIFTRSTSNKLMMTPIVGEGKERARRVGRKNGPVNMGDQIFFDEKTGRSELVFYYGTSDAILYFPREGKFQIYQDGYEFYLDACGKTSHAAFGTVSIDHVDGFNLVDIIKLSFDFNTPASWKYFPEVLHAWPAAEPGRAALIMHDGKPALNFSLTGKATAFSRVWAKGQGTVKCDFDKDTVRNFNLKPGWRYRLVSTPRDPNIVRLEELSEVNYFRQTEYHDFPVVTASIVSKDEND